MVMQPVWTKNRVRTTREHSKPTGAILGRIRSLAKEPRVTGTYESSCLGMIILSASGRGLITRTPTFGPLKLNKKQFCFFPPAYTSKKNGEKGQESGK